jgi:transposase
VCHKIDPASRLSRDVLRFSGCGSTKHADLNAAETILYRGLHQPPPEDTCSGSICGALCTKQGDEAETESRKAGSPVIYDGE